MFSLFLGIFVMIFANFENSYSIEAWHTPYGHFNDAKWWSQGKISDEKFASSLYLLLDESNKFKQDSVLIEELKIPSWFSIIGHWFETYRISDIEYKKTINYLHSNGLIKIPTKLVESIKSNYEYEDNYSLSNAYGQYINLFTSGFFHKDLLFLNDEMTEYRFTDLYFRFNSNINYDSMINSSNSVVVSPTLTFSAYTEPGFYTFYRGDCDQELHGVLFRGEECLTTKINYDKPIDFTSSSLGINILHLLKYEFITDIDVDKNPEILQKYDKVILLHNEYVTKKMFDAFNNHPKIIYLYPNALYAEVEIDYDEDTVTLIRGHNYPNPVIRNGFDWELDNSQMEYDHKCDEWEFEEIFNGYMLNCYPSYNIYSNEEMLIKLNEL